MVEEKPRTRNKRKEALILILKWIRISSENSEKRKMYTKAIKSTWCTEDWTFIEK